MCTELGLVRCLVLAAFGPCGVAVSDDLTTGRPATAWAVCIDANIGDQAWIPGGTFQLGTDTAQPDEAPARVATVDGFWMDRHEVTNGQFARFVAATGYVTLAERNPNPKDYPDIPADRLVAGSAVFSPPNTGVAGLSIGITDAGGWWAFVPGASWGKPRGPQSSIRGMDNMPVVHVAYEDALSYAKWAGRDLPTELEWEFAAHGGRPPREEHKGASSDARSDGPNLGNTWQGNFPMKDEAKDGFRGLAPVGRFSPNGYGLFDMLGNVWEWTSSYYRPNHGQLRPADSLDPRQPGTPVRVIKGGSYLCSPEFCRGYRPTARQAQDVHFSTGHIGFRTVLRGSDRAQLQ